jgi:hypothetical protein
LIERLFPRHVHPDPRIGVEHAQFPSIQPSVFTRKIEVIEHQLNLSVTVHATHVNSLARAKYRVSLFAEIRRQASKYFVTVLGNQNAFGTRHFFSERAADTKVASVGIDLSAETQFSSYRWRAEAAPADAPNSTWLARTKLHWVARSVRRSGRRREVVAGFSLAL